MQFFLNEQHLQAMRRLCQQLQQPTTLVEEIVAEIEQNALMA